MGAFFRSLWGELGRNTGKRISNALFGDKWSTPYRIGRSKDRKTESRRLTAKERRAMDTLSGVPYTFGQTYQGDEEARKEYQGKLASIVHTAIPKGEEPLVAYLRGLSVELSTNTGGKSGNGGAVMRRQLFNAACEKFSQAYSELERRYPYNPYLWDFFCTKIKLFFSRRPWKTLWKVYFIILILFAFPAITRGLHWWLVIKMILVVVIPLGCVFVVHAIRVNRYRKICHH